MPLTQVEAAKIMFAAEKWVRAAICATAALASQSDTFDKRVKSKNAAKAKFEALIATLTDSEGL